MAIADVTVYGAGVLGLSVAFCCARAGAKVQVIDPNGVASGASGGVVGALAPHTPDNWNPKKAFQFKSLIMASEFWRTVEDISGQPSGYAKTGRLQPTLSERQLQLAHDRARSAQSLWQEKADWRVREAKELGDWCPPAPTGFVIEDTLTGRIHPRVATHALAEAVQALGGTVSTYGQSEGIEVWATGLSGLQELSEALDKPVGTGVKGQGALLQFAAADMPQLFADALHIVPHFDGTVGIGSTSENDYDDPTTTDHQLDDVIAKARDICPILRDAPIIERWAQVRPRAKSRAPMMGDHPLRKGAYFVNGGFKIGFGMAPKIGSTMADLILNGVDTIPDAFRPDASL